MLIAIKSSKALILSCGQSSKTATLIPIFQKIAEDFCASYFIIFLFYKTVYVFTCDTTNISTRVPASTPPTCDQMKSLGHSVSSLAVSTVQSLDLTEFTNCIYFLGHVYSFSSVQWAALAVLLKSPQVLR